VADARPRMVHVRQEDGRHEVAIVAEIKASRAPTANDAHHLAWLRDRVGDTFIAGVVLHTGASNVLPGRKARRSPDLHAVVLTPTGSRKTSRRARRSV